MGKSTETTQTPESKPFQLSISYPVPLDIPEPNESIPRAIFAVPGREMFIDKEGAALLSDFFADLSLVLAGDTTDEHLTSTFKELNESCSRGNILPIPEYTDSGAGD